MHWGIGPWRGSMESVEGGVMIIPQRGQLEVVGNEAVVLYSPSNRRVHGAPVKRHDLPAAVKLKVAEDLQAKLDSGCTHVLWNAYATQKYGQQPFRPKKVMLQAPVWRQRVEDLRCGLQTRFSKVRRGRAGAREKEISHGAVGCRAKGG
eukprot:16433888-Heterocapsa_arctica.AAC.1